MYDQQNDFFKLYSFPGFHSRRQNREVLLGCLNWGRLYQYRPGEPLGCGYSVYPKRGSAQN